MDYSFLKQVIDQAEAYEHQRRASGQPVGLAGFAAWLQAHAAPAPAAAAPETAPRMSNEAEIGRLLLFMTRYARSYIRLGLAGTPLLTPDDFGYLATVLGHQPVSKTELIELNVHEKASGTEVIKRLLARGLVAEQRHATDRRSKVLTVTEAGQQLLGQVFGRMEQAAQLISGDLTAAERGHLLLLLQKLHGFHHAIYTAPRAGSFDELLRRLPGS